MCNGLPLYMGESASPLFYRSVFGIKVDGLVHLLVE